MGVRFPGLYDCWFRSFRVLGCWSLCCKDLGCSEFTSVMGVWRLGFRKPTLGLNLNPKQLGLGFQATWRAWGGYGSSFRGLRFSFPGVRFRASVFRGLGFRV